MKATSTQAKAAKGSVGIEVFRNKLRLRLRGGIFSDGKQRYISTGLEDTPENRQKAQTKAWAIEEDIAYEKFDPTLAKYRPQTYLALVTPKDEPQKALTLAQLWDRYTEYRKSQVQATTLQKEYQRFSNHIAKLPTQDLSQAIAIRDYLVSNLSPNAAKNVLIQITACCKWAKKSKLIPENPFEGMASDIKVSHDTAETIDPFSPAERDALIEAFETHPRYSHYAPFIKFLFWTGCRTGEAIGLQWKHINFDDSQIIFCESVSTALKIRKDTKTHKARRFPCNAKLKALLLSIKPENCNPDDLVFPDKNGQLINQSAFNHNVWKGYFDKRRGKFYDGICSQLVKDGKVERYRPQYNTRHTFITLALENGLDAKDVGRLVGNTAEIIYKHYAGSNLHQLKVPESI